MASRTKLKKTTKRNRPVCVCVKGGKGLETGPIFCQFAEADGPCYESYHLLGKKPVGCLLSLLSLPLFTFNLRYILFTSFRVPSAGALS